jgi:hypothetical protein
MITVTVRLPAAALWQFSRCQVAATFRSVQNLTVNNRRINDSSKFLQPSDFASDLNNILAARFACEVFNTRGVSYVACTACLCLVPCMQCIIRCNCAGAVVE